MNVPSVSHFPQTIAIASKARYAKEEPQSKRCQNCWPIFLLKRETYVLILEVNAMSSLNHLAQQYDRSATAIEERLSLLKERRKTARGEEAFLMDKRIELLQYELYDTRNTANYLRNYYRRERLAP